MLVVERQNRILSLLQQKRTAALEDLARELDVSSSTIRRDLAMLEQRGVVQRTHGGAIYTGEDGSPTGSSTHSRLTLSAPLAMRMNDSVAAKQAIASAAASLVQPQMTVLMDGGSTVIYAARQITARPIQVVTNSLEIAHIFMDDDLVELLLIGGNLYPRTGVTVGPIATGTLSELHADLLLFSVAGIHDDAAYNINLPMAQTEQTMMRQAMRSVMLMDSSKFGRKSLIRVCSLTEVDQIITDSGTDDSWKQRLGERLVIAG